MRKLSSFSIPEELDRALRAYLAETDINLSRLIQRLLTAHLAEKGVPIEKAAK
jgi:hypothetical protein